MNSTKSLYVSKRSLSSHSYWHQFKASIDAQEFPKLLPWSIASSSREREVRDCRRIALKLIQQESATSTLTGTIRSFLWPFLLPIKAWHMARDPELPGFRSRFIQGSLDLLLYNIRPGALRAIRARRAAGSWSPRLYVPDRENQAILITLNRFSPHTVIGDKIAFSRFCCTENLPSIPVIAHSEMPQSAERISWPRQDLFVKTANLWSGMGVEVLHYDQATDHWFDHQQQQIVASKLPDWLGANRQGSRWLIQPALRVDPAWAAWSPGPLGTVRVVTVVVTPESTPEIIAASMRLPRRGMTVDNFSAGALSAEIDWRTGQLDAALSLTGKQRWHDHHPDTGGLITGATVPGWSETCDLALKAHAAVPDLMAVGWDISFHDGRAILIEANPVFNLAPTVILGETRWVEAVRNRWQLLRKR